MRTRVLRKVHKNGSTITVKLKKKTVVIEGTRNGVDVAVVKMKRSPGWRDRFQAIVDDITKERNNESCIQAWIPSAASC